MTQTPPQRSPHRRWYDEDPLLSETLHLMSSFQEELKPQAEALMTKLEQVLGKAKVDDLFAKVNPPVTGKRWYDADPTVFKVVELLRVMPKEVQHQMASQFLERLKAVKSGEAVH